MSVPKLRFPEFSGEWEEQKLNLIFTKITQRNSDNNNSNVITNSATEGLVSQREYFDKDIANKDKTDNYFIIKNGDFVYNPRKSTAAPYGPFTQYKLIDDGIVSPLYLCLRKNNDAIESKYLEYYFKTTCWHQYIYENGSSGARHDRVSIHDNVLLAMPIMVPAQNEQKKIADFLSNVDSIITAETKILNTLQKKKKALIQRLFTQQLRFKSDDGTDFPEWEEKKLCEVCDIIGGGTPDTNKAEYWNGNIQWFTPTEIGNTKYISESKRKITQLGFEKSSAKLLPVGTILFTSRATLGEMSITTVECTTNQGFQSLIPNKNFVHPDYLYYLQPILQKYCYSKASGSTFLEISAKSLKECHIPLPCKAEQQKIADCLTSLDSLIQTQQKVVTTWQQRKKALLQQMFI